MSFDEIHDAIRLASEEGSSDLDLSGLELAALPSEICQLTNLTELHLINNQLTSLPPEIGQLTNLTELRLDMNQLVEVPPDLGHLSKLNRLDLDDNQLTSLPSEIGQLTNLTTLYLDRNQLTALPPVIGQLTNLTWLFLSGNQLTSLPPVIGQLTNLTTLDLSGNQLTTLPPEIAQLTNLTTLHLNNNQLTTLPPEIAQLTNLTTLHLNNNQLTTLPPEIVQLTNLTTLHLHDNQLTTLPPEIAQLTNLTTLHLNNNQLTTLPPEIGQLANLTTLHLDRNQLTTLPPEIVQLTNLTTLHLHDNQLTSLPPEIVQLTNLTTLHLNNNQLTTLPPEIGQLANLTTLHLYGNQLTTLPPEIGQLTNLTELRLDMNQLVEVPPDLGHLSKLNRLDLDDNQLTSLPSEIGQLTNLTTLYLDRNQLTALPPVIGQLTNLTWLFLSGNQLTSLPPVIGQLTNLTLLYLHGNQLTSLPPEIGRLTNLNTLYLHGNQLTALPAEIGPLTSLILLYLNNNQLTSLPPEIGQLTNLSTLHLNNNQLTSLPPEIGQLTNLGTLALDNNQLPDTVMAIFDRQGLRGLLDWIAESKEGATRIGQAKVLVLGEGGVGKTSLVAQLCHRGFIERPRTHGIELGEAREVFDDRDYVLRYWDFGGQELYRITHQFFFTSNTVYLVVWHAREGVDRGDVAGWLERIRLRVGPSARVILVATHSEGLNPTVDIDFLNRVAGDTIRGPAIAVDNFTGLNIDDLRSEILNQVQQLGAADLDWPASFERVSSSIEDLSEPQITWRQFTQIGNLEGLSPVECESAAIQLTVAGRLTYFKDAVLQGKVILKPDWLTTAISYVLNDHETSARGGIVTTNRLASLWTNPPSSAEFRFSPEDTPFLIELLELYGIGFRLPAPDHDKVLISQMVPGRRPSDLGMPDSEDLQIRRLRVNLDSPASRPGLIPGLTSRVHNFTTGKWWSNGVVFFDPHQQAWGLVELLDRASILLTVSGESPDAFFAFLRSSLESRLAEWAGLSPTYALMCPHRTADGALCSNSWPQQELLIKYQHGMETEFCATCLTPNVSISELLGRFPTATQADQTQRILAAIEDGTRKTLIGQAGIYDRLNDLEATLMDVMTRLGVDQFTFFRALLSMVSREVVDTPRLASIRPIGRSGFNPANWFTSSWALQLWCEHPGHEHPIGKIHKFTQSREWFTAAQPYLRWASAVLKMAPIARYALALGEQILEPGTPVDAALVKAIEPRAGDTLPPAPLQATDQPYTASDLALVRESIQLTESIANLAVERALAEPAVAAAATNRLVNQSLAAGPNPPSLRQLRILLHGIGVMEDGVLVDSELRLTPPSPTAILGAGPTSTTADGFPLWICEAHWHLYSST